MRIRSVVEIAQCVDCGGTLSPACDDWRHDPPVGDCTAYGTPAICHHGDCGMPAAVGALACAAHSSQFS